MSKKTPKDSSVEFIEPERITIRNRGSAMEPPRSPVKEGMKQLSPYLNAMVNAQQHQNSRELNDFRLGASPHVSAKFATGSSPAWQPSTPRVDAMLSVSSRVEHLIRTNVVTKMMKNARTSSMEAKGADTLRSSRRRRTSVDLSSPPDVKGSVSSNLRSTLPSYQQRTGQGLKLQKPKTKKVLREIDLHLRRRAAYQCLGEDMIVQGQISNKMDTGVEITITEVFLLPGTEAPSVRTPNLSSLSDAKHEYGSYAPFHAIADLSMSGVCQVSEMQTIRPSDTHTMSTQKSADVISGFSIGDQVKALVIGVDQHSERIYLSLNDQRISGLVTPHKLGLFVSAARAIQAQSPKPEHIPMGDSPYQDSPYLLNSRSILGNTKHDSTNNSRSATPIGMGVNTPKHASTPDPHSGPSYSGYGQGNTEEKGKSGGYTPSYTGYSPNPQYHGYSPHTSASPYAPSSGIERPSGPGMNVPMGFGYGSMVPSPYSLKLRDAYNSKTTSSSPSITQTTEKKQTGFISKLSEDPLFMNPEGMAIMLSYHHINAFGSLLSSDSEVVSVRQNDANGYKALRREQNLLWAAESCEKGKKMHKQHKYEMAMKCFMHALEVDPTFAPAYVGKGAVLVWTKKLELAVEAFQTALELDPEVQYAEKYLRQTQEKLQEEQAEDNTVVIKKAARSSSEQNTTRRSSKRKKESKKKAKATKKRKRNYSSESSDA